MILPVPGVPTVGCRISEERKREKYCQERTILRVTLTNEESVFVIGGDCIARISDIRYRSVCGITVDLNPHSVPADRV